MVAKTLVPGFRFPEATLSRDPAAQVEALKSCAVDPAVWAGQTEPTLWGNDGFRAMSAAGQEIDGYIHVEQRLTLSGGLPLGEAVRFSGETVSNEEVPRGRRIVQRFEVRRADGSLAVVSEHIRLLPDLEKMVRKSGPAAPPQPVPGAAIAEKVMQPQDVVTYSKSVGNEIHFDPEFAARYGYRAPLAQGLMTMTWMAAYLAERLRAAPMAILVAQFKRPVFWDDPLTLVSTAVSDRTKQAHLCALNTEGRVACDLRMEVLSSA